MIITTYVHYLFLYFLRNSIYTSNLFFRVAICSVRYNCNKDLANAESRIRDFDMIWLDDFVNRLGFHPQMTLL